MQQKQERVSKYLKAAEKQVQDAIIRQDQEEKAQHLLKLQERKQRHKLLNVQSKDYYSSGPKITAQSLSQLPTVPLLNPIYHSTASINHNQRQGVASRNSVQVGVSATPQTQHRKRKHSILSFKGSEKSARTSSSNFDCTKPFVIVNNFDTASSNYNAIPAKPKKKPIKLPVKRDGPRSSRIHQSSTYQPPQTRTRALISRTRKNSAEGLEQGLTQSTQRKLSTRNSILTQSDFAKDHEGGSVGQGLNADLQDGFDGANEIQQNMHQQHGVYELAQQELQDEPSHARDMQENPSDSIPLKEDETEEENEHTDQENQASFADRINGWQALEKVDSLVSNQQVQQRRNLESESQPSHHLDTFMN